MKRIFTVVLICILFNACKPGIPNDVIQPDKMEEVLFDIHAVDGYIGALQNPDTTKIVASSYFKGVYKKFDIDSALYEKSLDYYYTRPELLNKMYENLIKKFELERKTNDKRLNDEALIAQRKEFAKNAKVLVVPTSSSSPPKFSFGQNPFAFFPVLAQ